MATCPHCGISSRTEPGAMVVTQELVAKELGGFSLAGQQMKVSANYVYRLSCRCGWRIDGQVTEDGFHGWAHTQHFPEQEISARDDTNDDHPTTGS